MAVEYWGLERRVASPWKAGLTWLRESGLETGYMWSTTGVVSLHRGISTGSAEATQLSHTYDSINYLTCRKHFGWTFAAAQSSDVRDGGREGRESGKRVLRMVSRQRLLLEMLDLLAADYCCAGGLDAGGGQGSAGQGGRMEVGGEGQIRIPPFT